MASHIPESSIDEPPKEWSHEKTLHFIRLYKEHEHLWDRTHADYGRGAPRKNSKDEMSAELNVSAGELATKIHFMQRKFLTLYRKIQSSPEAAATLQNSWPYYDAMRFMEEKYRVLDESRARKENERPVKRSARPSKKSKKNTQKSTAKRAKARASSTRYSNFPKMEVPEPECIISDDDASSSDDCFIACSSKSVSASASFASPSNISMKYDSDHMMPSSTSAASAASVVNVPVAHNSAMTTAIAQSNDRVDAFFKAMADTVKSFPAKNIAETKLRIAQIVGEMELTLATEEEVLISNY